MEYKISENRMAHMHGVAEFMYEHAPLFRLNPDVMYILGLLHDIGYVHGKHLHEVHGTDCSAHLKMAGSTYMPSPPLIRPKPYSLQTNIDFTL